MGDYCVKNKAGKVEVIFNGDGATDEQKKQMAKGAAESGNYGPGCTVHPHTPPAEPEAAAVEDPTAG